MNEKVKEVAAAVGSMAEMTALFYQTLAKNGTPKGISGSLTAVFLREIIGVSFEKERD